MSVNYTCVPMIRIKISPDISPDFPFFDNACHVLQYYHIHISNTLATNIFIAVTLPICRRRKEG